MDKTIQIDNFTTTVKLTPEQIYKDIVYSAYKDVSKLVAQDEILHGKDDDAVSEYIELLLADIILEAANEINYNKIKSIRNSMLAEDFNSKDTRVLQ